ncbi:MAG: archaeosine synthase subunit alpha [Candidatus Thermoplasmatota archaeon]
MDFYVVKRDGPARIGELKINGSVIKTPNLLFPFTKRYKPPKFAEFLISDEIKDKMDKPCLCTHGSLFSSSKGSPHKKNCIPRYVLPSDVPLDLHSIILDLYDKEIKTSWMIIPSNNEVLNSIKIRDDVKGVIVGNADHLMFKPRLLVDFIINLRRRIGYQRLIYLPGVADPSNLSLLCYLGVDLLDSLDGISAARANMLLTPDGSYNVKDLYETPCSCPVCTSINDPSNMSFIDILNHNYNAYHNELKTIRNAIRQGTTRDIVERRIRFKPECTAILRILDSDYYNFLEERTPLVKKKMLIATSKESLSRPEIKRFQERVKQRYHKPESTRILVLLPCSAKKPYSFSKTHQLFRRYISNVPKSSIVHEVVITSPIGLVPRDLELVYPASRYDTPVTGVWDEDEKKMIRDLLKVYLKSNKYDYTIVHLPRIMQDFIIDLLEEPIITCVDTPTSEKSLCLLNEKLMRVTGEYEDVPYKSRMLEDVKSLACFQFGRDAGIDIVKDCEVKGRYPEYRLFSKGRQIAMIPHERGYLSLTIEGAKRLYNTGVYWVSADDDFPLKGSLLSPGVKDADPCIRIDDEVVVVRDDIVYAVGVAQMNGLEMIESEKGEAVRIRHTL